MKRDIIYTSTLGALMAILVLIAALTSGCTSSRDAAYWNERAAIISQLPPDQRAQARIDLLRDEHAQTELERQRIHDIVISSL